MSGAGSSDVLVACIGNTDRGDDGIGPAVAGRLRGRLPAGIRVIERSGDVLALIEEWHAFAAVIIVDAAAPTGRPGRVHRLDLSEQPVPADFASGSTHAFGLAEAVELARSLRRLPRRCVAYLVEGERFDIGAPLSPAVTTAIDSVIGAILGEIAQMSCGHEAAGAGRDA